MIICVYCGRNIDALAQDNMSCESGRPLCEDCEKELREESERLMSEQERDYYAMIGAGLR